MIKLKCMKCEKDYQVQNYRAKISKYCSRKCHNSIAGKKGGAAGKGVTRNNGVKRPYLSERNKKIKFKAEKSGMWKGEKAGYAAIHCWVKRNYGKPTKCERCMSTKNLQWANKSHKYIREDRNDWMQLCTKCHVKYDRVEKKENIRKFKNHLPNPDFNINLPRI